jgi:Phosphotransferase enzyme family
MGSSQQPADTYRLVITRRNASEVLLVPTAARWILPRVQIERHQRVAEQLISEASKAWSIETYCLFVLRDTSRSEPEGPVCALMESLQQNALPPVGMCWMPSATAGEYCDVSDASAIRSALADTQAHRTEEKLGPFAQPGWMRKLFTWANEQIAPLGLRLTGKFRQLNASPTFALIRLDTEGGAVWFKATGEPNSHELSVTTGLARFFPRYLPAIFGVHQEWNGWLAAEATGVPLDEARGVREWERVAADLAALQIESIENKAELLETGLRDLRTQALVERIDPFLSRMREFMAAQEKRDPAPLAPSELATLAEALKDSCAVLESMGLPDTVGHTDFNPGNIIVSNDRCVFLDWAEGCVANPLLTFEYLQVYMAHSGVNGPDAAERLTAAYLRPWMAFYSPEILRRALALAPLLAVYAFAVSTDRWRTLDIRSNPALAAYFRSIARRMYREAIQAAQRSEPCLS